MIKVTVQYNDHLVDIHFPCSETTLQSALMEIHAADDNPPELFVTDVIFPEELNHLKDRFVNLDELNYLAKRMESFFGTEEEQFYEAMKQEGFTELKDLINLSFKLKLFFKWGIEFDEDNPYAVPDHGGREVQYAEKKEIMDGIIKKYHPDWIVKDKPVTDGGSGISGQDQAESESHEPQQTPPKKPGDKKGGGGMNPVPPNRRTALKPAQEVKPNEPS